MSELKPRLKALYFRLIDALHRPFVRPGAEDPYHVLFRDFPARVRELPSAAVLEIGSRNVTGVRRRGLFPNAAEFVGFDVLAGQGVDVVGDAHRLASFLPREHFDVVFAISVFEHLLFPWKVVMEVNAVTKPGGLVFVSTHPAWPAHELPWDFWRYQPAGLRALFHHATGFELLTVSDGLPCKVYSLVDDPPTRPMHTQTLNQAVAALARKIGPVRDDRLRWELDPSEVIDTMYPANRREG
jgi:SAM-dependent methyltransferase